MSTKFALALKKCRIDCRQTQASFSEICGTNPYTIKSWETGRSVPNYKNFELILDGLNDLNVDEDLIDEITDIYNKEKLGVLKNV